MWRVNLKYYVWILFLFLIPMTASYGADTLRVASYNLLNYDTDSDDRHPYYRDVIQYSDPDVLIVQEIHSQSAVDQFLSQVINYGQPGIYTAAPFNNGWDTDNAMFYKTAKVTFIPPLTILSTDLRDINGYRLRPAGNGSDTLDIHVYSAHFKAGTGYESERLAEAQILRNHLNSLTPGFFIAGGDFNLYTSSEPAYQELIESQADNSGRLYDPMNAPGNWHDNGSFAGVHTQSTRTTSFGGGATGGLDDRFDFLLPTYNFQTISGWQYLAGSYTELGNDGNHLNQAINAGTNTAVPEYVADALHYAADHLLVYLDIHTEADPGTQIVDLTLPDGGETWYLGGAGPIAWLTEGITGNLRIELNRTYPSESWEIIYGSAIDDGYEEWPVSGSTTASARLRIYSITYPAIGDTSAGSFSILEPYLALLVPNGGETWYTGDTDTIRWTYGGVSGDVRIEINRDYPAGDWDSLTTELLEDEEFIWPVTGPETDNARIRLFAVSQPATGDTSDYDFEILQPVLPPVIAHDPHGDAVPGTVLFTAVIEDDLPGLTNRLFYKQYDALEFDSLIMNPTGYTDEYSAAPDLPHGLYDYFIRSIDADLLTSQTDTLQIMVAELCGIGQSYDDGTAEIYNWAARTDFEWAVRFTPPQTPFVLCASEIAVAGFHPDTAHSPITVRVYDSDGLSGLPGTLLRERTAGSVGNVIGGLPSPGAYWTRAVLFNDTLDPLTLSDDFYISVSNADGAYEAFALDNSSASADRSYLYEPCDEQWYLESAVHDNTRDGNRMIRILGWSGTPSEVVIAAESSDVRLSWASNGSAYYRIYSDLESDGTFAALEASVSDTTVLLPGILSSSEVKFFQVISSSGP